MGETGRRWRWARVKSGFIFPILLVSATSISSTTHLCSNLIRCVGEQGLSFFFPEVGLQFLALHSAWEIDEFFKDRSSINDSAFLGALLKADEQLTKARNAGTVTEDTSLLHLPVWHHPSPAMKRSSATLFSLGSVRQRCGYVCTGTSMKHAPISLAIGIRPGNFQIAGAGSFGAGANDHPESTPRLYNLLEIARDHSWAKVQTRHMRKDGGAGRLGGVAWDGPV